jgi:hypothetical protein
MNNINKIKRKLQICAVITLFTFIVMAFCAPNLKYKQVRIPLDNQKGVPYYYSEEFDYSIEGFEVDKQGNFYFLGGEKATLSCFKGNSPIFRKTYTEFMSNQIYAFNDKLYVFDDNYNKNNLFVLDKANGEILNKYPNIIKNSVNSYLFRDTSLIMEVFDNKKKIDMSTQLGFALFSLTGKFIKQVNNAYNFPVNLSPKAPEWGQFLGQWKNDFVFWNYDYKNKQYKFSLKSIEGKIITTQGIDEELFGKSFYENPLEHKKLRNDTIYMLGYESKNAVITKLPLKELFNQ